ncbi:cbb3-type cytochrome c oxidase subunit 3 [Rhodanobacter glycinis]|uniref:Cbb3-type cytochrome c oxidase subunit 3 n=1 Tax=Rhodanobacter glycinis TaxID=582702 RepID=A0A5B9E415_9GAMM|nr:cbb3-type cytochrome c oxidase subunit 3 [Rhodanobacter glycinis]QEE25775.1 cbb3-type cytochrome c oxidase subunit 3 [Rhodanobacter glycinis]
MNPIWGHVAGVVTVLLMLIFIGIWIWAWRKRHKKVFDYMAKLPLQDDDPDADVYTLQTRSKEEPR